MKRIDKELKEKFSNVSGKEIPNFFSGLYGKEHRNKIRTSLEQLKIYDGLCNKIKEELDKLEKQV